MENYYQILGVNSSATPEEIRRAYRILARRYHPDVNPGKTSEDRFKLIASAYEVLSNPKSRTQYDLDFEAAMVQQMGRRFEAYRKQQRHARRKEGADKEARVKRRADTSDKRATKKDKVITPNLSKVMGDLTGWIKRQATSRVKKGPSEKTVTNGPKRVSILEISITVRDGIYGLKKTVEIAEPEGIRKVSVTIPPGVRTGSLVRLRNKESGEELVFVIRISHHPFLSIQPKGLVAEIPITLAEAINGASITVPTLEDTLVIKIPAGTQSGNELRIKEKGILAKDGVRGDLFYKFHIKVPEAADAVGLKEKVSEVERYYEKSVRLNIPETLLGS